MRTSTCYGLSLIAISAVVWAAGCKKPTAAVIPDVRVVTAATLPADPNDAAWNAAPEHLAKLIVQDLVEPRLMTPSTAEVRVRAITNGTELAIRVQWVDPTENDRPGPAHFSDACAIQVPAKVEPSVPAPQMGEPGKTVEVTFWRASWQAVVDGRGDSVKDLYPNASVDHYPFQAASLQGNPAAQKEMEALYAPARSLENTMAGPRKTPVQDLIAQGPGTLTPAPAAGSNGRGKRTADGWAVVISRRLPAGVSDQTPTQIALAVWEGAHEEVGARKMRSGWIPLTLQAKP
jgi:DMSO reductase family type II enzyme heme b subunit